MSLRARLIVAMAVVGVLLVLATVAITRTTEDHLVGQLDDQLADVANRGPAIGGPGPGGGGGPATKTRR